MASSPSVVALVEDLVSRREYEDALNLCQEALVHASNEERGVWLLRIGQLHFLNDTGDNFAWHTLSVPTLRLAVERLPSDADALFWLGYAGVVIPPFAEEGFAALHMCLELRPDHPYANDVLAQEESDYLQRLPHLRRVLKSQPNNYRILKDLALCAHRAGFLEEARAALHVVVSQPPYVETNCGLMNRYANDVLLQRRRHDDVRRECQEHLKILDAEA